MAATVKLPGIGEVRTAYVWAAVAVVGGFVGWRYYQAARSPADESVPTTVGVGEPIDASGVVGSAVSGNVQYAGTTTTGDSEAITSNDQWTAKAANALGSAGFDSVAVYTALGHFLARRPLDDREQSIVAAAIAAAGQPPVGGPYSIIPQTGPVTLAAPTGLAASSVGKVSAHLAWAPVSGAASYRVIGSPGPYMKDVTGTTTSVHGLRPGTTYTFQVAGNTPAGKPGPASSPAKFTTKK